MSHFFTDMLAFLKTLSIIDFVLYFAVLILIILIISLVYVMKTSEEEEEEEEKFVFKPADEEDELIDLKTIINTIDENPTPAIDMTAYEAEQEEKAIISYDELINTTTQHPINYDHEELIDNEIKVKKINLDQITNPNAIEEKKQVEVKLFNYNHEEAFLKTLKQLNELLN